MHDGGGGYLAGVPQQGYSQGWSPSQGADSSQGGAGGYGLSLSQDFALTASQEELYRIGEVWGAGAGPA